MERLDSINPVAMPPCRVQGSSTGHVHIRNRFQEHTHAQGVLIAKRTCYTTASDLNKTSPHLRRESVGGKGMFLDKMQRNGLPVPEFQCVTTEMVEAIEQHAFDTHHLAPCIPGIVDELAPLTSLTDIKDHIKAFANQVKRTRWLSGLSQFIASHDFYELVKESEAAGNIRSLKMPPPPVIVRSSGINEDNYGDAQAGKYLSEVQGHKDVLRTCLKVLASGYRPEVCTTLQPMALIIQRCIDCRYGGVAMSYQSLQDDSIQVEYTPGQPRGAVAGLSDSNVYSTVIDREADFPASTVGQVSRRFMLRKNDDGGYSEIEISHPGVDRRCPQLSDNSVAQLRKFVLRLEDLLLCPVDVEFAIDHHDRLFLLQVRPITRLSGGMVFAMSKPEETLATGKEISEGYCTGTLWSATHPSADTMPEGAIVVARHGEPWMLEPEYLQRAGGFVFAAGGSNDHVAITLRQAGKPCLLAKYSGVTCGQQATLVCARLNGLSEAFLVAGDLSAQLTEYRTASSASEALTLPDVLTSRDDLYPPEGVFDQVDTGFRWLTEQNSRLLAFFASGGGLDCLANPMILSMSAQRSEILAAARVSTNQLVQGAEALLQGYQAFLLPAGRQVKPLLDELPGLITRFGVLKQTITSTLDTITSCLNTELADSPGTFGQWMVACQQLQSCLQELHPRQADQVLSVHDLIFAVHKRFVDALGTVASVSGQCRLTEKRDITFIDDIPSGQEGLLRASGKAIIEQLSATGKVTTINMVDALIVNLCLGNHVANVELFEHAEGGKGRTLRLKFSDYFCGPNNAPGKLKRMWFLVQLLKAAGINKEAGDMKVCINAVAGQMIVECPQMLSRHALQDAFETLIVLLNDIQNADCFLGKIQLFAHDQWDFNKLAQRLENTSSMPVDRFAFNQCLFSDVFRDNERSSEYPKFLSNDYQQFIEGARRLVTFTGSHREMLTLMGDEISQDTRRQLLHHLLPLRAEIALPLLMQEYHLENKYFVLRPSCDYSLQFHIDPHQQLSSNLRERCHDILTAGRFRFASPAVRNDKETMLSVLKMRGYHLEYVGEKLKCDKEIVMAAVCEMGDSLRFASPELQDDDEFVMAAITSQPSALRYASERIRSDKQFIRNNTGSLNYASETLLNDPDFMLSLIKCNANAFFSRGNTLQSNHDFLAAAIQCNPEVKKYL